LLVWMLFFTLAAMVFMPWLIYIIAWGFAGAPDKLALTTNLTVICFPYLLCMSLTALQGGVLNSLNRFTAAAFAPILLNLVMIGSNIVVWFFGTGDSELTGYIFAYGVSLSGLAQFVLLAFSCKRAGIHLWPSWPKLTPSVKQVVRRSIPGIISGGIMQINLLISSLIATGIPHAVANLYYAERLYQLPLGIIGVAIGVVLLPTLSRQLRAGDTGGMAASSNRALEFSLLLTLPAATALVIIPAPILHTVFEHGNFSYSDTIAVAPAVAMFAVGLPAFTLTKIFQPIFYAREDTKTPMRFSIVSVIVNVIASLILSQWFGHIGIALSTSISAWTNAVLLYLRLRKMRLFALDSQNIINLPRIFLSAVFMGCVLTATLWMLTGSFGANTSFRSSFFGLILLMVVSVISYFGLAWLFGVFRLLDLKSFTKSST
jgi:putative peptidoglycan lipid II flippase